MQDISMLYGTEYQNKFVLYFEISGCTCCNVNFKYNFVSLDSLWNKISKDERRFSNFDSEKTKVERFDAENKLLIYCLNESGDILVKYAILKTEFI